MASTKDYLEYVLDLLKEVDGITFKRMMGEYILYKDGIIFGGIYDNRFLVKIAESLEKYGFKREIPYPSAKEMYLIDIDDSNEIRNIVLSLIKELK